MFKLEIDQHTADIRQHIFDSINDYEGSRAEELHQNLFNTDYWIIGAWKAQQWIGEHVFDVMEAIREYEQSNFGEVSTKLHEPEHVANMWAYILGEKAIYEATNAADIELDGELTKDMITKILNGLKEVTNEK